VRIEKHVKPIALNSSAPIKHLDNITVIVTGDNHLGPKRVPSVGSGKSVTLKYLMPRRRYAVGPFAAAFRTRAIRGNTHTYRVPSRLAAGIFGKNWSGKTAQKTKDNRTKNNTDIRLRVHKKRTRTFSLNSFHQSPTFQKYPHQKTTSLMIQKSVSP
jgi:hypothetical protein